MRTILIVEDNPIFRQSLKEVLRARFIDVLIEEADDGSRCMSSVRTLAPHLIFMDIRLGGENGLELTRRIKSERPEIPVIIITNYDIPEYRDAARQYGADHFMPKGSSNWDDITALVESILNKDESQDSAT